MDSYYAKGAPTPSVLYVARHFCCLTVLQLVVRRLHSKIPVIPGYSRIMCIFFGKSHIDEVIDVYDQAGVSVRSMKISDIITEKGLTTQSGQSEASITTPSPPSKLRMATPSFIDQRRRIIEHNIQAVQQGGIKLSDWKEDTQAVKECGVWRSDDVSTSFKMKNDQAGISNRPVFIQLVTPHPVLHNRRIPHLPCKHPGDPYDGACDLAASSTAYQTARLLRRKHRRRDLRRACAQAV